jgi:putative Ca2+/H+ antiporter (TMEM165/GDT1 family)
LEAFWFPLFWVFLAELGDKTQLVALSLATRFNTKVVLAGIFFATLLVHVISVALGGCMGSFLPQCWIDYAAGLAFIGFGLWTLRGDEIEDGEDCHCKGNSAFWIVTCTFFLAELGDKTMLTTVAQAGQYKNAIIQVWLGSSLGMVVSDGLAIIVGRFLGKSLPERQIKIGASFIFFAFGIWKTWKGVTVLPPYTWAIGAVIVAALAWFFFRPTGNKPDREKLERQAETMVEEVFEEDTASVKE